MKMLEFFQDEMLLEVGRIAVLRGELEFDLLSAADQLLCSRLGDQGIGRVTLGERDLPGICEALVTLCKIRGIDHPTVQQLSQALTDYLPIFELAIKITNGSWTYLGGSDVRVYGLFMGETVRDGDLQPEWFEITIDGMREVTKKLLAAHEAFRPVILACRFFGSNKPKP